MAESLQTKQDEAKSKGDEDLIKHWNDEVERSLKREKKFRDEAKLYIDIYEGKKDDTSFNILYANTETLSPAIYNSAPRPDTRPRARQSTPVADAAAGLVDAYLIEFIDHGDARYCSYDDTIRTALDQSLVPGRGSARFHYRATVAKDEEGNPTKVKDEIVYAEPLDWDKFCYGYAKSWKAVPWVCFIHSFTRDQAVQELGGDEAKLLKFTNREDDGERKSEEEGSEPTATVYEIWDKESRKVFMVAPGVKEYIKKPYDDPYKLLGFFPMQEPLMFGKGISALLPIPLYRIYRKQAEELNRVSERIIKLTEGLKVRGAYDSQVEQLKQILEQQDNEMVALQYLNSAGQAARLDNAIWLVPIENHIKVLKELLVHRMQIKQVIYEIMGIADIMRGASNASETLGAQEIKNRWGTLRLKKLQSRCATWVRDGLRIATELAFTKLGPDTLRMMTGSTLPGATELQQMEQTLAAFQASGQQMTPQMQEMVDQMALPAFEECLELLKNDIYRKFQVDIETNSTIDVEATEDKESIAEFMNAMAQFLSGVAPLVENGSLPFDAAKGMLIAISRRFRLGRDLEEHLKKMQAPQGGDGQAQKEMEKVNAERMKLQQDRFKFQMDQLKAKMDLIKQGFKNEMDSEKAKMEIERLLMELERTMMQMGADHEQQTMQLQQQEQQARFGLQQESQQLEMKGAQLQSKEKMAGMNDQVRNAKFDSKQKIAQSKQAAQRAQQQRPQPRK